jgi:hypothetical protein
LARQGGAGPRQQGAGSLSQIFMFLSRNENVREETPLIFRGRWDGAK